MFGDIPSADLAKLKQYGVGRLVGPIPNYRFQKQKLLYRYARDARDGCIIELGAHRGHGTIALALGAMAGGGAKVYAIDKWEKMKGWAGEEYGPADLVCARGNLVAAGVAEQVVLVQKDIRKVGVAWRAPVSLIFWDIGLKGTVEDDLSPWLASVVSGGRVIIKDTADGRLGGKEFAKCVERSGAFQEIENMRGILVLEKTWTM